MACFDLRRVAAVDRSTWARACRATALSPRPVVLATLSVRVDPVAERVAIEAALETGARLLLANMIWLPRTRRR